MDDIERKQDEQQVAPSVFFNPDSVEAMDVAVSSVGVDPKESFVRVKTLWIIFFLIVFFNLYEYLLRIAPGVMASEIMAFYQLSAVDFGRLSSFFYFIYAPMQIAVGLIIDRYGLRCCLPIAALICSIGVFLFAVSKMLGIAQIGRLMIGLGSAFAFVGGLKFLMVNFSPRRFGFLAGLLVSACLLGGIIGQITLAFFLKWMTWRWLCFSMALLGALLSWSMFRYLYEPHQVAKLDKVAWRPLFLSMGQIFKNFRLWLIALVGCLFYLPMSVFAELWGIPCLKTVYNLSNLDAAYAISMMFLGWAVGCPLMGWVADYFKAYRGLMSIGGIASCMVLSAFLIAPEIFRSNLPFFMFILGFLGSTQLLAISMIRHHVLLDVSSVGVSFLNTFVLAGGFLFQPFVGFLLDQSKQIRGVVYQAGYTLADYQSALFVLPIALFLATFLSFFIRRIHHDLRVI